MNTIMAGFDGTEEGHDGLRLGSWLARGDGCEVIVAAAFGPGLGAAAVDLNEVAQGYFRDVFAQAEARVGPF